MTVECPVNYSCSPLIPVTDVLLLFGGLAVIFIVVIAVITWLTR